MQGNQSSDRQVSDLTPPPGGPAPGAEPSAPLDLRAELLAVIEGLDHLVAYVTERAAVWGITDPYQAQDTTGRPLMADLTIARANALVALANLGE